MSPLQVIGDADTVLAFALGGIPGHVVRTADEASGVVDAIIDEVRKNGGPVRSPVLILVTQKTAALIRQKTDRIALDAGGPLVLEIPGFGGQFGQHPVERFVGRVLGAHL